MEEKNIKKTNQNPEKVSYEQLENIAHQLSEQNKQLYAKLQAASMNNVFKRLDYLFKVLEFDSRFNSEFVESCASEIKDLITIPEESKKD